MPATPIDLMVPLSPDSDACDSSLQGGLVEHTTTFLTVNPVKGCSLGCTYCFRYRWHPDTRPTQVAPTTESVNALMRHPLFEADHTPLSINVSSTDAFLPRVRELTMETLDLLDRHQLKNPVGLVTKMGIRDQDLDRLQAFEHVRIVVLVSYANLPKRIEPVPVEPRLGLLTKLMRRQMSRVMLAKPLVPGWNTDSKSLEHLLKVADGSGAPMVVGGLRLSSEIARAMTAAGVELPKKPSDFADRSLPANVFSTINRLHREHDMSTPVYKHTSCAISYLLESPNYNGYQTDPTTHCTELCSSEQRTRCGTPGADLG